MADYTKEQLIQMLREAEQAEEAETAEKPAESRSFGWRGRTVEVDMPAIRSWATVRRMRDIERMPAEGATLAQVAEAVDKLMAVVTDCTDLSQDDVLDACGGPMADFGEVAEAVSEIAKLLFPKA